jgi:hypothetical protein
MFPFTESTPALRPTPPLCNEYLALTLGVGYSSREVDSASPSTVEFKNTWSYSSFVAWYVNEAQRKRYIFVPISRYYPGILLVKRKAINTSARMESEQGEILAAYLTNSSL